MSNGCVASCTVDLWKLLFTRGSENILQSAENWRKWLKPSKRFVLIFVLSSGPGRCCWSHVVLKGKENAVCIPPVLFCVLLLRLHMTKHLSKVLLPVLMFWERKMEQEGSSHAFVVSGCEQKASKVREGLRACWFFFLMTDALCLYLLFYNRILLIQITCQVVFLWCIYLP